MPYNFIGEYFYAPEYGDDLAEAIRHLAQNKEFLRGLLMGSTGHADMHWINKGNENNSRSMKSILKELSNAKSSAKNISLLPEATDVEIRRVSEECVNASHFVTYDDVLYSLSIALSNDAENIAYWINNNRRYSMDGKAQIGGRKDALYEIVFDAKRFVGGGIALDGNEYVTSAVKVILNDRYSSPDYSNKIPFSLVTCYPDISQEACVGSLYRTGRYFGKEIADRVNTLTPQLARIYWGLRVGKYDPVVFRTSPLMSQNIVAVRMSSKFKKGQSPIDFYCEYSHGRSFRSFEGIILPKKNPETGQVSERIYKMSKDAEVAASEIGAPVDMYKKMYDAFYKANQEGPKNVAYYSLFGDVIPRGIINDVMPPKPEGLIFGGDAFVPSKENNSEFGDFFEETP